MRDNKENNSQTSLWVVAFICAVAVIFSLACGGAYTGIQEARRTAAKASLGQIESVLQLAQRGADDSGLKEPEGSFSGMLKSYTSSDDKELSRYEKYVLDAMLEVFGSARDFDFAVTKYEDGGGVHTYIYYFPTKGRINLSNDRYYMMKGEQFTESAGV